MNATQKEKTDKKPRAKKITYSAAVNDKRILRALLRVYEERIILLTEYKSDSTITHIRTTELFKESVPVELRKAIVERHVSALQKSGFLLGVIKCKVHEISVGLEVSPNFLRMEMAEFMTNPSVRKYVNWFEEKYQVGRMWKTRFTKLSDTEKKYMRAENRKRSRELYLKSISK